ncbi:hypothetical protein FJTKL_15405 [Diaporthe vaccinii]|uniref:NACHT domain-containing protein n=1 Tax=Diaporthe vaccinii TaxID=105482 RepID=A0ABR4E503_9PEZI
MPPFVTDSGPTPWPNHHQNEPPLETPFSRAIDDFLRELNAEDDPKNPFLRELKASRQHLAKTPGCKTQAQASAANLRDFMESLQTQKSSGRGLKILARLEPFIDSLARVMGLCENMLSAAPFGVSIAFSGARIVLRLAVQMQTCLDSIVDAMEQIGISLKCYDKFAQAFPDSDEVQDLLASSYKNIVCFWFKASRILSRHSLKTVIRGATRSIEKEIKTALDGLSRDSSNVMALAQATTAEQAIHERESTLRQGVIDWIKSGSYIDVRPILQDQLDLRLEGTCNWLFEDKRFLNWCNATENAALWYNAKPGSGKSVYAATIIDYLKKRDKKVAYFFYSFNSPQRKFGISGMRSLALQLLKFVTGLPDRVVQRYKDELENCASGLDNIHTASHVVHELLTQCEETFVVIDGVDECLDDDITLITLHYLMNMPTYGRVKWLFTSRNYLKIRTVMDGSQAVEIEASTEAISHDIRFYFSKKISCEHCIDKWTEGEDNFLYSKLICDTLQGEGLTSEAEIRHALKTYPKNLNAYYLRALEKLSETTEQQQELARRTFSILIAAAQSISLDEIRNILAVTPDAEDHDPRRVPFTKDIENLCTPLVTFGKPREGDDEDNPLLKLCHKTVEDFFLQSPENLSMDHSSKLRKYFVTYKQANEAIAMDCLSYLQYKRYESPTLDLAAVISKPIAKEHAFLPYAATFWAQHCDVTGHSPPKELGQAALQFLQGTTLRTCLEVQAYVGPYLFGRYVGRKDRSSYKMCIKGSRVRDSDSFGVPLPQWLDTISLQGWTLDRSMCHFIGEWREVLISHPDGLASCLPLRKFEPTCQLSPQGEHKSINVAHIEEHYKHLSSVKDVDPKDGQLLGVAFGGKTLWVDLLFYRSQGHFERLQIPLFAKKKSIVKNDYKVLLPEEDCYGWAMTIASRTGAPETVEAWRLDPQNLSISCISHDTSKQRKVPLAFSRENVGRRKGSWEVQSTQNLEPNAVRNGSMQVLHAKWKSRKNLPDANLNLLFEQDDDSDSSSSESEEEEVDNPAPVSPESSSDDGSDDDSVAESTASDSRRETANETSDTDSDSEADEGHITDCLILTTCDGDPSWHPWSGPHQVWSRIGCAVHPVLPLLAVSHTSRQLEVIDTSTRAQKTKHLPDLSDLQDAPVASLRELRFSPCGNYIHFLSVAFVPQKEKASTEARVTLSTFNFNHEGNSDDTLLRECPPQRCTYTFGETLADVPFPLALTHWSDTEVIIALPPLTCDPKVLKIMLPVLPHVAVSGAEEGGCTDGNAIVTLKNGIYFPTSTPSRHAHLMYRNDWGSGGRLYLVLDRLVHAGAGEDNDATKATENGTESSTNIDKVNNDKANGPDLVQVSPAVVLRWKIAHRDGWRAWDPSVDGTSSDLKRDVPVWKMLRGQFVDSDKLFSVPIRSGLDWRRKGYLSCSAMG